MRGENHILLRRVNRPMLQSNDKHKVNSILLIWIFFFSSLRLSSLCFSFSFQLASQKREVKKISKRDSMTVNYNRKWNEIQKVYLSLSTFNNFSIFAIWLYELNVRQWEDQDQQQRKSSASLTNIHNSIL